MNDTGPRRDYNRPFDSAVSQRMNSLSRFRRAVQWPLLVLAVAGLTFAPIHAWQTRSRWMRIFDKLYGDPIYEAFRRYDLESASVRRDLISVWHPSRDGIPPLTNPASIDAGDAFGPRPSDRVIGIVLDGRPRAYPLKILFWHQAVNDRLGGVPLAVTYCPFCDSTTVFNRTETDEIELAPSGLLYNSNALFYTPDESGRVRDDTLWSQLKRESVLGPLSGRSLAGIPHELTTWEDWRNRHPETTVLSAKTGMDLDYGAPLPEFYTEYLSGRMPLPMFNVAPVAPTDQLDLLDRVLGVWNDEGALAIPLAAFSDQQSSVDVEIDFGNSSLQVAYQPRSSSLRVTRAEADVQWAYAFWFAWYAFHPDTEIYRTGGIDHGAHPDHAPRPDERPKADL